jgi:hypothetical protein
MGAGDWWRTTTVAVVLSSGAVISTLHGTPNEVPSSALGWPLLLHLERSVATIGLTAAALLVGVRALKGVFPFKLGQVEYLAGHVDRDEQALVDSLEKRVETVERAVATVASSTPREHDGQQI